MSMQGSALSVTAVPRQTMDLAIVPVEQRPAGSHLQWNREQIQEVLRDGASGTPPAASPLPAGFYAHHLYARRFRMQER
jgi:hypothetical protein